MRLINHKIENKAYKSRYDKAYFELIGLIFFQIIVVDNPEMTKFRLVRFIEDDSYDNHLSRKALHAANK